MKKSRFILCIVAVFQIVLVLSACGGNSTEAENYDDSAYEDITLVDNKKETVSEEINHVTDYVGPYISADDSDMEMFLSAEEENGAHISISRGETHWEISGKYDNDTKVISYDNGRKTADSAEKNVEYSDGKGEFSISENDTITWKDNKENKTIVFQYSSDEHE